MANTSKAVALSRDLEGRSNGLLGLVNNLATTLVSSTSYQPGCGATDRTAMGNSKVFDRDFDTGGAGLVTGYKTRLVCRRAWWMRMHRCLPGFCEG
jgi:hypothetical protein